MRMIIKNKIIDSILFIIMIVLITTTLIGLYWQHGAKEEAIAEVARKNEQIELLQNELNTMMYDTKSISDWHDGSQGIVRVVEGKVISQESTITRIEDTNGELWEVANIDAIEDSKMLLFIADSKTPENKGDDVIIRLYLLV